LPDGELWKMKVNVKFLASIREIAGTHEIQFELGSGDTVKDLLGLLESRLGAELKKQWANFSKMKIQK
jgi:molybdopterin synthase sulfur carrier subunit